uniref:Bestrophin homolog n=2 Tax=Cacopsylla melanoneura TaxID=428564 RepID=A0A8D8LS60_9HEMI
MTVSYSRLVANGSSFGCFWGILGKWRGSVYKLVWRELVVYLVIYYIINFTYRFAMLEPHQMLFERLQKYCAKKTEVIPMSFVLGFYVSLVVKRWWEQYRLLPWPDTLALFVSAAIPGVDERGRLMRRNIVRYAVLAYVITLKHVSVRVKKRFPTLQHIVDAGLMMDSERKIFELMDAKHPMAKYWLPLTWATNILTRARREATITSDHMVQTILTEFSDMRWRLGSLIGYDNVNLPLVYTQVVTISVYTYFLAALVGAQITEPRLKPGEEARPEDMDVYIPIFTVLQFCFYLGWLKVAEVLIGPFGEDDDDIELNWLIDRHIKAAYMIVDEMHEEHPELLKDQYWDEVVPKDLPYTLASECYRKAEPKGSAEFYKVKEADSLYANITRRKSVAPDDVYADYESVDTPMVERRKNWFQKQIHRMGSVRSSSVYSSNRTGLFGRTRHNSVYSSPENGGHTVPQITVVPDSKETLNAAKLTLYDKLVGSGKTTRQSSNGKKVPKLNGAVPATTLRNRPRIPTPDVTKEDPLKTHHQLHSPSTGHSIVSGADNQSNNTLVITTTTTSGGGTGTTTTSVPYTSGDLSLGQIQVVLSPILESDPNHQMTITSTSSVGAAALAQAVLNPALMSSHIVSPMPPVSMSPVTLGTVSISQPMLSSLGINSSPRPSYKGGTLSPPGSLTEIMSSDKDSIAKDDSACGSSSGSVSSTEDRSRKTSTTSQTKRGEVYV